MISILRPETRKVIYSFFSLMALTISTPKNSYSVRQKDKKISTDLETTKKYESKNLRPPGTAS